VGFGNGLANAHHFNSLPISRPDLDEESSVGAIGGINQATDSLCRSTVDTLYFTVESKVLAGGVNKCYLTTEVLKELTRGKVNIVCDY